MTENFDLRVDQTRRANTVRPDIYGVRVCERLLFNTSCLTRTEHSLKTLSDRSTDQSFTQTESEPKLKLKLNNLCDQTSTQSTNQQQTADGA